MILLLVLALPVCAPAVAAPDGAQLYGRYCAACHGSDGRGGVGVPLALPEFLGVVNDHYLRTTIRTGRPGRVMPAFPHLSDAQVDAIVVHIRGWAPQSPERPAQPVVGNADRGAPLYAKHCASCHGANGEGGEGTGVTFSRPRDLPIIAPALRNSGFLRAASDQMIQATLMRGREGTPMGSFLDQGLSEPQINDIVSHIRSFETATHDADDAPSEDEPPILEYESKYSLQETVESVKQAVLGANYNLIRVQYLDQGLVEEGAEDTRYVIVYFCNFPQLNQALAIDPRVGLFLPCRVTVSEQKGNVKVQTINPKTLSRLLNNEKLDQICDDMYETYNAILEEATI